MGFSKSFGGSSTGYNTASKAVGENVYIKIPRQLAELETKNMIRFRFCLKNNNAALNVFSSDVYENKCFNHDIVSVKINIKNPDKKYSVQVIQRGKAPQNVEVLGENIIESYETRMQHVHDLLIEYVQIQEKIESQQQITEEEKKKYESVSKSFAGVKGELLADAYVRSWQEYMKYKEYLEEKAKEEAKKKAEQEKAVNGEANQPADQSQNPNETAIDPEALESEFDI